MMPVMAVAALIVAIPAFIAAAFSAWYARDVARAERDRRLEERAPKIIPILRQVPVPGHPDTGPRDAERAAGRGFGRDHSVNRRAGRNGIAGSDGTDVVSAAVKSLSRRSDYLEEIPPGIGEEGYAQAHRRNVVRLADDLHATALQLLDGGVDVIDADA
jgi:hypothetical protein